MSAYPPPIENIPIFDSSNFEASFNMTGSGFTINQLKTKFLSFPVAQSAQETIPNLYISGSGYAPTLAASSNSTAIATTAFVKSVTGSFASLVSNNYFTNSLNEFKSTTTPANNTTITPTTISITNGTNTTSIGPASITSSSIFGDLGNSTATTQTTGNNSTLVATTAFTTTAVSTAISGLSSVYASLTANNAFTNASNTFSNGGANVTTIFPTKVQTASSTGSTSMSDTSLVTKTIAGTNNTTITPTTISITNGTNTTSIGPASITSSSIFGDLGNSTATTQTTGNNSTLVATTAFTQSAVSTAISGLSSVYASLTANNAFTNASNTFTSGANITTITPTSIGITNGTNTTSISNSAVITANINSGTGGTLLLKSNGTTKLTINATGVTGDLIGNADTATKATNLAGGAANKLLYQSSTGNTSFLTNGSTNQILTATTGAAPSWSSTFTGNVTGNLVGDVNGTFTGALATDTTAATQPLTSNSIYVATTAFVSASRITPDLYPIYRAEGNNFFAMTCDPLICSSSTPLGVLNPTNRIYLQALTLQAGTIIKGIAINGIAPVYASNSISVGLYSSNGAGLFTNLTLNNPLVGINKIYNALSIYTISVTGLFYIALMGNTGNGTNLLSSSPTIPVSLTSPNTNGAPLFPLPGSILELEGRGWYTNNNTFFSLPSNFSGITLVPTTTCFWVGLL